MARTSHILTTETAIITVTVGILTAIGMYWYQNRKRLTVPKIWTPVAKVKQLYIYPLKSGRGIELKKSKCTPHGMRMIQNKNSYQFYDRNMVVYSETEKQFQSARTHPKMIFIEASPYDEQHFLLNAPGMATIKVKIPNTIQPEQITQHKGEKIYTLDCGDEAAKWISQYMINKTNGMRLGFYDGLRRRNISKTHEKYLKVYKNLSSEATGMYTDLSSFMVINQASIDELSNRIPECNLTVRNFRPNIVVEDKNLDAYAEDDWNWIKIGDVVMYMARHCTRCVFTTINPETGVKSEVNEPLRTLRTYRMLKDVKNIELDGNLPVMGVNLGLLKEGEIHVGDTVYVGKI